VEATKMDMEKVKMFLGILGASILALGIGYVYMF